MAFNYRILEDGRPIAWFVHSQDAAAFVKDRPGLAGELLSVEMTVGLDNSRCLAMKLSRHGNLLFTGEPEKAIVN